MVATFRSLLQPLLLLVSVPFAATGAIALQVITGIPLGVASLVGVLMLVGIVVTNAIVLVDLVNQYRDRGMPVRDALLHGSSRRLRPILMTALATIFALLPMAIGLTGHGGFISQPLALVVIGGLVSSTALTLIVLPVLYDLVEGGRERREAKRAAKAAARGARARARRREHLVPARGRSPASRGAARPFRVRGVPHMGTSRSRMASAAAAVRERTPSLSRMLLTWRWTVRSLRKSRRAISWLDAPAATRASTSSSRARQCVPRRRVADGHLARAAVAATSTRRTSGCAPSRANVAWANSSSASAASSSFERVARPGDEDRHGSNRIRRLQLPPRAGRLAQQGER